MFNVAVWTYLPPCKEMVQTASDSLDRKLGPMERVIFKLHLMACEPCVKYLEQSKFIRKAIEEMEAEEIAVTERPTLSEEARERMKQMLRNSAGLLALLWLF
jgi:hypothetical protein